MTFTLSQIRPLRHRILVDVLPLIPTSSALFPGFKTPPAAYLPSEVPAYVRKRLLEFLEAIYPIPPKYLRNIIRTAQDIAAARAIYASMRADGMEPGEVILEMGLMSRPFGYNVPEHASARIIASGCDCLEGEVTSNEIVIASSAGEPVSGTARIIWCHEALGSLDPRAARAAAEATQRADRANRVAFSRLRLVHSA